MIKRFKKLIRNKSVLWTVMNLVVFAVVQQSARIGCVLMHHQPKMPDSVKKLRKF